MTKIFLSGAVEETDDFGVSWRRGLRNPLQKRSGEYVLLDPTEFKENNKQSDAEIVDRNVYLQQQADILLVEYMIPNRSYIGTDYEMVMAKEVFNQPRIVFAHESYLNRTYLKYLSTYLTDSIDDAIDYMQAMYPPK